MSAPLVLVSPTNLDVALRVRLKHALTQRDFRCKDGKTAGDLLLVSGKSNIALAIITEKELLFSFTRKKALERLRNLKKVMATCYTLMLSTSLDDALSHQAFSLLIDESTKFTGELPPVVFCASIEQISSTVQMLHKSVDPVRKEKIQQLVHKMNEALVSKEKALQLLVNGVPGIESERECILLQDFIGSLASISRATARLMISGTPMTSQTAVAVEEFFRP